MKCNNPRIKCKKCKNVIQSKHRHDFVWCKCKSVAIDGGGDYTRVVGDFGDWEWVKNRSNVN